MEIDYSDIEKKLQSCKNEWYEINLKNSLESISDTEIQTKMIYKGGLQFVNFLSENFYDSLIFFLNETVEKINEYLSFAPNKQEQIKIIENKLPGLYEIYKQNQFAGILAPDTFFDDLNNRKFPYYSYLLIYSKVKEKIKDSIEKGEKDFQNIYFDVTEEIFSLTKLLIELALLKNIFKDMDPDKEQNRRTETIIPNFDENKYPKLFKSGYGFELFRYLVQVDDNYIGPAWAQKYFDLLKEEEIIKKTARPINLLRLLKIEFQIDLPNLDNRAGYNEELLFFREIEKDFQKKYNVNRTTP